MLLPLLLIGAAFEDPSSAMAGNPLLWADVPDVAMVRVGDTYYMASTTMAMSPGLPIMKSKDLVGWTLCSYAYETLEDDDRLNLIGGKNAYAGGTWASSLRHHRGTFYASTFSNTTGKTYVFSTDDPEKTPWKKVSFSPSFHDHSLFFDDDGRVYLVYGAGDIRLVELKPDLSGVKPGGVDRVIVPNATAVAGGIPGLPAEGSQLRKIDGRYYLCNIAWPRGDVRTEIVHRADRIEGPYEGRVMFKDRGIAQGGMIDTPDGRWYAYLFQDHGAVGRIPWLVPMRWADGWPVVGIDGKAPAELDIPASKIGLSGVVASDEFDRRPGEPDLPLAWQWNHQPDPRFWSVAARPGFLRLTTGRVDPVVTQARNTLTQRTFGPRCSATTRVEVGGMKDGDIAGLVALQYRYGFVGVRQEGGARRIVMVAAPDGFAKEIASLPLGQDKVHLRIDCDFRPGPDVATFAYSLDGQEWRTIGEPLQMWYDLEHFIGYRFGLFNFATETPGGFVDFDFYRVSDRILSRS